MIFKRNLAASFTQFKIPSFKKYKGFDWRNQYFHLLRSRLRTLKNDFKNDLFHNIDAHLLEKNII